MRQEDLDLSIANCRLTKKSNLIKSISTISLLPFLPYTSLHMDQAHKIFYFKRSFFYCLTSLMFNKLLSDPIQKVVRNTEPCIPIAQYTAMCCCVSAFCVCICHRTINIYICLQFRVPFTFRRPKTVVSDLLVKSIDWTLKWWWRKLLEIYWLLWLKAWKHLLKRGGRKTIGKRKEKLVVSKWLIVWKGGS